MSAENDHVWPAYRLIGGIMHRQDIQGGRWEPLSSDEANDLLAARCDGQAQITEPSAPHGSGPRARR